MGKKTRIFISSATDASITSLRNEVYTAFNELGHQVEMYEKTFGPWGVYEDSISTCLDYVRQSDMFCLFIGKKAGSMVTKAKRTVTHLEFIEAMRRNKWSMIFCDELVKNTYFSTIAPIIHTYVKHYEEKGKKVPKLDEILSYLEAHKNDECSQYGVDIYVWVMLYDITTVRNIYIEGISLGTTINWKEYLSDILRQGVAILPYAQKYEQNNTLAKKLLSVVDLTQRMMSQVKIKDIPNKNRFLASARNELKEIKVENDLGYTVEQVGTIGKCTAICLFKAEGNQISCIACDGDTDGDSVYTLTDKGYVVVDCYNKGCDKTHFMQFENSNEMLYMAFKINAYIICYHFSDCENINEHTLMQYKHIIDESVYKQNAFVLNLVNTILGGVIE